MQNSIKNYCLEVNLNQLILELKLKSEINGTGNAHLKHGK